MSDNKTESIDRLDLAVHRLSTGHVDLEAATDRLVTAVAALTRKVTA